jgi:dTDP-4-dehydrorhamnose reductase
VVTASAAIGGPSCRIMAIPSAAYPQAATRPADSRLDCSRLERAFGIAIPGYRTALEATVTRILRGTG